jgi:hypothetical protein
VGMTNEGKRMLNERVAADDEYGPGFTIDRAMHATAASAVKAKVALGVVKAPGKDWVLHVNHVSLVPSIGRHAGPNWTLHIDAHGVPSIRGKA